MRFYNPKGSLIDYVGDILNPTIEYEINVPPIYRFSVPAPLQWKIPLDATFTSEFGNFIVKEKIKGGNECDFVCKPDFSTLQENVVSKAYITITAQEMLNDLLSGSGWTGISSGTIKRTATFTELTPYAGLEKIAKAFKYEIEFDSVSKTITMEPRIGRTISGVYFHDEFNLREVGVSSDSYDLITRLIPRGADDLGIESVNSGVPYVENYTYTDKIRTAVWTDERYTNAESLKADGIEKLDALAKPRQTFEVDVINVAVDPAYGFLEYRAGDVVDLMSVREGIDEVQRIVKIVRRPSAPEEDTLMIANVMRDYTVDLADTVEIIQEEYSNTKASLELLDDSIEGRVRTVVTEQVGSELPIYTWIKYADDDQGTNMSDDPAGKTYIGLATGKTSETASNDPSDYKWSLIQGPAGRDGLDGIDGEHGHDGIDGTSTYTHIAYANSADGSIDFSTSDGANKEYIGIYVDEILADDQDPSRYRWTLIKGQDGTNGTPGMPGADGKTPYFHVAYSNAADGSIGFSTTVSLGKTYIGTYTDFIEADSSDPSDYKWTLIKGADGIDGLDGIDGKDGLPGIDGTSTYTHIAYATNSNGTEGFSTSDATGKTYIGIYVDSNVADSEDPDDYKWTLIKGQDGTNGIPGNPGADGKTPYFHIAYANSADGVTGFSTTVSTGKSYIGTYTDYIEADSTDPDDYSWTLIKGQGLVSSTIEYYRSTSSSTQVGGSWSHIPWSYVEGRYMWTRLKQVWENPADTTYTDPVLDPVWSKIHEHEASIQVNADNILSRVSQSVYDAKMGTFTGTVSEIKQTADAVKFDFENFQVGGENLIRQSHMLSDKFEAYQGSTITTAKDDEIVPEWGAENATQIRTSSLGTSDLKARWVISNDLTFMTGKAMVFSVYAKNNRSDVSVTISTNRIGEPVTLAGGESRKIDFIGVHAGNEGKFLILELRAPTSGYYLDVTLWHPKWELGDKTTEWSPHPDEFYTGVTKIDKDGITVAKSNQEINSHLGSNGLIISEGERDAPGSKAIAGFTDGGAWIGNLQADTIRGDVINTHPGGIINIGSGYDYTSISEALKAIGNAKHLLSDLTFRVYNQLNEDITIRGFTGGMVYIAIMAGGSIHGDITYYQNGSSGYLYGYSKRELVRGSIRVSGPSHLFIRDLNMDPNDTSKTGLVAEYGGSSFIMNCDIIRCRFGALAQNGGTITALNNIGLVPGSNAIYNTYNGGVLYARGTMPMGSVKFGGATTGFWHDFTTTQEPSEYDPPTAIPTLMSQTFSPTKIETYSYQYDAISSYYPNRAAQNRWDTDTSYFEGRITFAGAVRNYINDRNGDTGLKVELQVRRYSGTNGPWSGVAPDNQFSTTGGSFGSVEKGEWSGWVTLSPTLISTSGYTFKFGSQSTGNKYAVWDGARIRVTKTKNI